MPSSASAIYASTSSGAGTRLQAYAVSFKRNGIDLFHACTPLADNIYVVLVHVARIRYETARTRDALPAK